jgi:enterochelin esterase family protein
VDIYVPDTIINNQSSIINHQYPALYLIHGINGYEGAWQDRGSAVDTLAAMIAAGRCEPMILVMPDCNKWPFQERPISHGNKWKCVTHYGKLTHEHVLEYALSDLIDHIDTTYQVSYGIIAGLSDGGRIAANAANARPDRIRAVGLFSPVLHKDQLPKDSTQQYSVYVGTKDIFAPSGRRFHRRMARAGYTHRFVQFHGSHNWPMWRNCLSNFLEKFAFMEKSSNFATQNHG